MFLKNVLVPFYRGAVVFEITVTVQNAIINMFSSPFIEERLYFQKVDNLGIRTGYCSRRLLSRSGCIYACGYDGRAQQELFSSPFIEERLYFVKWKAI